MELHTSRSQSEQAAALMAAFAERTGLASSRRPLRYLWTDAFAVCNYIALGQLDLALKLVEQVHSVLGRHRRDDVRVGWISGLSETEGARHPTAGGLRIGKPFPERRPEDRFQEELEWERDGQYFHYLTRWMHALDQLARATGEPRLNLWARELAQTAYRAFVRQGRMVWKMNIDLSRAAVPSMGHHDPLDGYVTCAQLRASARRLGNDRTGPMLDAELEGFGVMVRGADWRTSDPLGIGGLLTDAYRVHQLVEQHVFAGSELRDTLVEAAHDGLVTFSGFGDLERSAERRLGFRELGLAIGLHGAERMDLEPLRPFVPVATTLEEFWLEPRNRENRTWTDHLDINEVMLATSLVPGGYLELG